MRTLLSKPSFFLLSFLASFFLHAHGCALEVAEPDPEQYKFLIQPFLDQHPLEEPHQKEFMTRAGTLSLRYTENEVEELMGMGGALCSS